LLALFVVPIALAGSDGAPQPNASAVSAAKFKKLKRQVADLQQKVDQLQTQQGPQGTEGPAGPQGQDGIPGPTMGDLVGGGDPFLVPPEEIPFANRSNTVTAPAPGRLLVMYYEAPFSVDCTNGGNAELGLFVDGTPVPGTVRVLADSVPDQVNIFGVSAPVTAGEHDVALGVTCYFEPTSIAGFSGSGSRYLGAVLLGS
jgi:hypothetical protein